MKTVAWCLLEETLRDMEVYLAVWLASQASRCGMEESEVRRRVELDVKKKEVGKIVRYVRSHRGITNVMGFAGPLLMDATFEQRLDSERHLIGIKGGCVVDLRTGACEAGGGGHGAQRVGRGVHGFGAGAAVDVRASGDDDGR